MNLDDLGIFRNEEIKKELRETWEHYDLKEETVKELLQASLEYIHQQKVHGLNERFDTIIDKYLPQS